MNKKIAIICCVLGASGMIYGTMNFDLGGIRSTALAIAVSMSITLGAVMFLYGAYSVFKGKPKTTTTANKGEKPMSEETKTTSNTSVELMKREKELETRRKELESLLAEVTKEEQSVEKELIDKGWVQKDGSWVIE